MKVQCGQCPAKYAVSDERLRDKKVRIHCKRCHASIVVDGKVDPPLVTSTPARRSVRPSASSPPGLDSAPAPAEREPDSQPSPRPVAHTIMGGLEAPAADRLRTQTAATAMSSARIPQSAAMPEAGRGFTDPPLGAAPDRWRVALTRQDLRWMTTEEIIEAYHAGAVKLETFIFRAGMPNWVTLLEVPEVARALGEDTGNAFDPRDVLSPSSMPPPRKSPSSRPPPPPRKGPRASLPNGADVDHHGEADADPFALVAERASSSRRDVAHAGAADDRAHAEEPARGHVAAHVPEAGTDPKLVAEPGASPGVPAYHDMPAPAPFSSLATQRASESKVWLWVAIAVAVLAVLALLLGPRFGLKLF